MSPYLWHNCGAPSLKSLPGRSRLWLNPARELCERLLFSCTYIEHPSEVTGWLMFPKQRGDDSGWGWLLLSEFIPGDDSGVQHSPGWADGGRQLRQRGSPGTTGEVLGSGYRLEKKKEWTLLSQLIKYVFSKRWYKPNVQSITVRWITFAQESIDTLLENS